MQTEARPKEPFTLGVLFRYKLTIASVAVCVVLGGYARIVTQPVLYEATARLAVRFTSEALALQDMGRGSSVRLPLLEEEVKAYMVQITDPQFIAEVIDALMKMPTEGAEGEAAEVEPGLGERFREQFLRAYYDIRAAVFNFLDTLLLTPDAMLTQREQEVMRILSRLTVSAGTEASHIITVTYQNRSSVWAERTVNTIARTFIENQKKGVEPQNLDDLEDTAKAAREELVRIKVALIDLQGRIGSPTLEEAIRQRALRIQQLGDELGRLETVDVLLGQGVMAYDAQVPVGTYFVVGELERQFLNLLVEYNQQKRTVTENPEFYDKLAADAEEILEKRSAKVRGGYQQNIEARQQFVSAEIERLKKDTTLADVAPEYMDKLALQSIAESRVAQAEADLAAAREFNKQLKNKFVSQNIRLWQAAQEPPFPLPQHRGLKMIVVIALGLFAGCAVALLRHQVRPKRARRIRPRAEDSSSSLILLPDEEKREPTRGPDIDISFPRGEGTEGRSPKGGPQ